MPELRSASFRWNRRLRKKYADTRKSSPALQHHYHKAISHILIAGEVSMATTNGDRATQVRIHLKARDADIELPQETGPILVSTGKSLAIPKFYLMSLLIRHRPQALPTVHPCQPITRV